MPTNSKTSALPYQGTPLGAGSFAFNKKDAASLKVSPVNLQLEFEQYFRNKIIIGRHRRLRYDLERCRQSGQTVDIPKTLILGDSIPEGTGATTAQAKLHYRLGVYMQQWTGVGANTDWTPINYAVGGGDLSIVANYLAEDGDLGSTLAANPRRTHRRGWLDSQGFSAVYFCAFRNAFGSMTQDAFREMFSMLCTTCKRKNIDLFVINPPPQVDASGAPAEGANYAPFVAIASVIAASEGASWIDMNLHMSRLYAQGNSSTDVNDLNAYMYSGDSYPKVHLNDTGHDLMAQLLFQAITGEAADESISFGHREPLRNSRLVGKYVPSVSPAGATAIVSFVGTSTARAQMRGEGATPLSFKLTAAQTITFQSTGPVRGVIIMFVGGAANTGSFSVTHFGQSILSSGTYYGTGGGSFARENAFYLPIARPNSCFGQVGSLVITANGGPLEILGVTFIQDELIPETRYPMDQTDRRHQDHQLLGRSLRLAGDQRAEPREISVPDRRRHGGHR
jgi:lysophospholipase L1-like esterase